MDKKYNIDIDIMESTSKKNHIVDSIRRIYGSDKIMVLIEFALLFLLVVLTVFSASALLRPKGVTAIVSQLVNENGEFPFRGWELTPSLEAAIEAGNVSLKSINVIEKGGEITFDGGDAKKIAILEYKTEIEDNIPQIYSAGYFEELKKQGKNVHVVRVLGLATETDSEGAE
jgi:competence protein ComGC